MVLQKKRSIDLTKNRLKRFLLLFHLILLVSGKPLPESPPPDNMAIITMKVDLNEIIEEVMKIKTKIDNRLDIVNNGLGMRCSELKTTIAKTLNQPMTEEELEMRDFKIAYCIISDDIWMLKPTQVTLQKLQRNLNFVLVKLENRIGLLKQPLADDDTISIGKNNA